jgi:hypothetical protein
VTCAVLNNNESLYPKSDPFRGVPILEVRVGGNEKKISLLSADLS